MLDRFRIVLYCNYRVSANVAIETFVSAGKSAVYNKYECFPERLLIGFRGSLHVYLVIC